MIICGSAADELKQLDADSVQTVITSPPYFQLRNYEAGAGEIGNEPTLEQYVASLMEVFDGVRHVLKPDGTFWLNLGDTMKNGALLGMPWRVAFAMKDAGWFLRSEIVWAKPNPMPESAKNRPTRSHEKLFLFTQKKSGYKFNQLKEAAVYAGVSRGGSTNRYEQNTSGMDAKVYDTRNKRDVWSVKPATLSGAHFAIFPDDLIAPCIEAGSDAGDVVLDPFSGSGTTGVVARKMGRDYIGVELSAKYARLSKERISGAWKIKRPTVLQTWHKTYIAVAQAYELEDDQQIRDAHEHVSETLDRMRTRVFDHNDLIDELLGSTCNSYLRMVSGAEDPDHLPAFDELVDMAENEPMYAPLLAKGGNPEEALFETLKTGKLPIPRFEDALDECFEAPRTTI
jgi:site-specific DNA-methyltransferase (adenine-specific)